MSKDFLILSLYTFFLVGSVTYLVNRFRLYIYFKKIEISNLTIQGYKEFQYDKKLLLPYIGIFVPARNEGFVIENTIRRLAKMDYPKNRFKVFIIVDERELKDKVEVFTKDVVLSVSRELHQTYKTKYMSESEEHECYNDEFGSHERTYTKSTKGRALNYALQYINEKKEFNGIELIGILDADGRLHSKVLKEVGLKKIFNNAKLLQGPVFQISNFRNVTLVGIAAGLELAIHHMTELPAKILNNKVQFLAGTNYFIDKEVISQVRGWDQDTLVEDAELALRIYSQLGIKAEWLSCPELEQSPENFRIYKKQRERWARGHLCLIKHVLFSNLNNGDKVDFILKIISSQFRFIIDFFVPVAAICFMMSGYFNEIGNAYSYVSFTFLVASLFILDLYGHVYRRLVEFMPEKPSVWFQIKISLSLFFFMPFFMFIQAVPRLHALFNFFSLNQSEWYKTERTRELIVE